MPSRSSGFLCNRLALAKREFFGSRLAALFPGKLSALWLWVFFCLANGILDLAGRNVHDQLCQLVWIAWPFFHAAIMASLAMDFYGCGFQTETPPLCRLACNSVGHYGTLRRGFPRESSTE